MKKSFGLRATALSASSLILLAGCAAPEPVAASSSPAGTTIAAKDLWLKATQDDMSSAFGTIENTGDHAVTITQVSSTASGDTGLQETVANESGTMVMREKTGGFTIEARGKLELVPGANHLMIMDPEKTLKAGDEVTLTLELSDGSSFDFTAPVKDFAGAKESYDGSSAQSGHGH